MDFPFSIDDVMSLLGITFPNHKDVRVVCPICKTKNLTINRQTETFACYKCGDTKGRSGTALYSKIYGVDNKTAYNEIMQALNKSGTVREIKPIEFEKEQELASVGNRHIAYSTLLSNLSLSDRDSDDLYKRGFLPDEVKKLEYKSAIAKSEKADARIFEIPKEILKKGISLLGIPYFYKSKNKDLWILNVGKNGILVPYRNRNALIQGFQLRKHNEELGEKEEKYSWVSSRDKNCGTASKSYIHYACDFEKVNGTYQPVLKSNSVLLTEGAMKGDLFHAITKFPAICVAGVNALSELDEELDYLKSRDIEYILIGYDMDYEKNEKVAKAVESLKSKIENHGLKWQRILWDSTFKGIDDYYAFKERNIK